MSFVRCGILFALLAVSVAFELPPGLRPAKAVGDAAPPIVPVAEQEQEQPSSEPSDQKTPPNVSLRSRMMAAMSSKEEKEKPKETVAPAADEAQGDAAVKPPVIFHKAPKKTNKTPNVSPAKNEKYRINLPAPPSNKNYGVNTLLQTNLVDSKGRVMKGVNVVPIRVPGSAEMKNAKASRATASQVESEAENVVPIRFGKAGGRR
uniref:Translation initiation factor IF-2 n=1 Tax=Steinernema glaseri TaxID=37863 RepID=A0A1I7XZB2_9BILA